MSTVNENEKIVNLQIDNGNVAIKTNAESVIFENGENLESAVKSLTKDVNKLRVSETKNALLLKEHTASGHVDEDKFADTIVGVEWNDTTGVITFTKYDGTTVEWDTMVERISTKIEFNPDTDEIVFTRADGTTTVVNVHELVNVYTGVETDHTDTTVSDDNQIQVDIKENGIVYSHLCAEIVEYLTASEEFITKYADKIEGIEEGANNYKLPVATAEELGGVKVGQGFDATEDGKITVHTVLSGENVETATPASIMLQAEVGPTPTVPTMEDSKSYITSEGNIINYKEESTSYDYVNSTTNGAVESGLTMEEVSAKFTEGLELIDQENIEWYNDGTYNYAVQDTGEGFKYDSKLVLVGPVTTQDFVALLKGRTLVEGQYVNLEVVFDDTDPNLKYFTYTVDEENKTVTVTKINYDVWYAGNGNYDIVVPSTLGNYAVILDA